MGIVVCSDSNEPKLRWSRMPSSNFRLTSFELHSQSSIRLFRRRSYICLNSLLLQCALLLHFLLPLPQMYLRHFARLPAHTFHLRGLPRISHPVRFLMSSRLLQHPLESTTSKPPDATEHKCPAYWNKIPMWNDVPESDFLNHDWQVRESVIDQKDDSNISR